MGRLVSRLYSQSARSAGAMLFLGLYLWSVCSDAAEPSLKAVVPSACEIGKSTEVTLIGAGLDAGGTLYATQSGLAAEHLEKNRFRVTATSAAALGDCDLWVATKEGLSGPRRFRVTDRTVLVESGANETSNDAQAIVLPSVVHAKLDKSADLDWFTFEGVQGERVTIACRSTSLDGSAQPVFRLLGPSGCELLHSPSHQLNPVATITLPDTGPYRVLVHDRAYRQDEFRFYRLELATSSRDTPLVSSVTLLCTDTVESTAEETHSQASPQAIDLPCRIKGTFAQRGDVDWFRFQAQKDQVVHVETVGERLGQLMDLEAAIYDADGKAMTTLKDTAAPKGIPASLPLASLDPATDWKVPADGKYSIAIRDLYGGSVFGTDRVYELVVEEQQPRVAAVVVSGNSKPGRGLFVKRGAEAELAVIVLRTGGFTGPVTIRAKEPLVGMTIEPIVVAAKEVTKSMKVAATHDAPVGFRTLQLAAEAEIGSDKETVSVRNAAQVRAGLTRPIDGTVIYVSE